VNAGQPIRVALVDDHAVVRMGFRLLLETAPDIIVVGEADGGEAACEQYRQWRPDVTFVDVAMPGMGGIETARRIRGLDAKARIIALSSYEDASHSRRMLKAGAMGYLSKRSAPDGMTEAVYKVMRGEMALDPHIAHRLATVSGHACDEDRMLEALSEREFETFICLARGMSVAQAAEHMGVAASTAGTYLYNIKQKLALQNQAEMTLIAIRQGLIEA
jgi:two-component system invasion response regulator UvrY